MKTTKKREVGVGDNLYGIPINDILSPEELDAIRNDISKAPKKKREKKKKQKKYKVTLPEFKKISFKFTKKGMYTALILSVLFVVFLIFKDTALIRIFPKLYISHSVDNTITQIFEETDVCLNNIFGFDLYGSKEVSVVFDGDILSDSHNIANGLSVGGNLGYSRKNKNALGVLDYSDNGKLLTSVSFYLNDKEVGLSLPEITGEFWVAPSETFGKQWNNSGFRKVSYEKEIDENTDISFSNIFDDKGIITQSGLKKMSKIKDKAISSSKFKYMGETKLKVGESERSCRNYSFTLNGDNAEKHVKSFIDVVLNDNGIKKKLWIIGEKTGAIEKMQDISKRLSESITVDDVSGNILVYNGDVSKIWLCASYSENNVIVPLTFELILSDKNKTDDINLKFSVGDNYKLELHTLGNRTSKEVFTDKTYFKISNGISYKKWENSSALNFKDGSARGIISLDNNGNAFKIQYSGKNKGKNNISLELDRVDISVWGSEIREISARLNTKIEPKLNMGKMNGGGKRKILEMNKLDTENYLKHLQENEKMKAFTDVIKRLNILR